jgi:hypothetical protein
MVAYRRVRESPSAANEMVLVTTIEPEAVVDAISTVVFSPSVVAPSSVVVSSLASLVVPASPVVASSVVASSVVVYGTAGVASVEVANVAMAKRVLICMRFKPVRIVFNGGNECVAQWNSG